VSAKGLLRGGMHETDVVDQGSGAAQAAQSDLPEA
jgi:hypothetical protein